MSPLGKDYGTQYAAVLPNGMQVDWSSRAHTPSFQTKSNGVDSFNLSWAVSYVVEDFRALLPLSLQNVTVLSYTNDPRYKTTWTPEEPYQEAFPSRAVATVCIFYPCIKRYSGAFVNATLQETLLSEAPLEVIQDQYAPGFPIFWYKLDLPCVVNKQVFSARNLSSFLSDPSYGGVLPEPSWLNVSDQGTMIPRNCLYMMDTSYTKALAAFLSISLNGSCSTSPNPASSGESLTTSECDDQKFWLESFSSSNAASIDSISAVFSDIAMAATTAIRLLGRAGSGIKNLSDPSTIFSDSWETPELSTAWFGSPAGRVLGDAHAASICYQVAWVWLIFPAVLLAAVFVLLLATLVQTVIRRRAGKPTWKSSVLPLLFHGLLEQNEARRPLMDEQQSLELSAMEKRAENLIVRFEHGMVPGFRVAEDNLLGLDEASPRPSVDTQDWQQEILRTSTVD